MLHASSYYMVCSGLVLKTEIILNVTEPSVGWLVMICGPSGGANNHNCNESKQARRRKDGQ